MPNRRPSGRCPATERFVDPTSRSVPRGFPCSHLAHLGLPFINADVVAARITSDANSAAILTKALRQSLVEGQENFVFETVFSDPVGDKIGFFEQVAGRGYEVVLCFIGLASPDQSAARVVMRVLRGGHNVPSEKLRSRFPRTLSNLQMAISRLPNVFVFDNSDLCRPFRFVAAYKSGQLTDQSPPIPSWLERKID